MKTRFTIFSILSTISITACGGSSGGDGQKKILADDARPAVSKDCETQWQEKVAAAPVGEIKVYANLDVTTGSGDPAIDGTVRSESRFEVLSATDEAIVTADKWQYFEPALGTTEGETRLTKENFMLTCSPYDTGDDEVDPEGLKRAGVTILEDRQESVGVKAGTFDVQYQKIHVKADDGLGNEVLGDHWTMNDETVVVKEKIVTTSKTDGTTTIRTSERELIEYVAPALRR